MPAAYTNDTRIADLTVGQFREVLRSAAVPEPEPVIVVDHTNGKAYGIKGIRDLFGVSHPTACKYKSTFLEPAVSQCGRVIVTDIAMARKLFDEHNQ